MGRFVRMAGVGSGMGVMEAVEARSSITPEMTTLVSNKGLTNAAGIIEEIIIAPIAVIIWAVIAVVIAVTVVIKMCRPGSHCSFINPHAYLRDRA